MLSDILLSVLLSPWLALAIIPIGAIYVIYTHVTHPLSKVPAIHWSAPFSSTHILFTKFFPGVRYTHYNAHVNKDGDDGFRPVLRVGPNEVSIMTTQGAEVVFTGGFDRAPWYDVFSNFGYVKSALSRRAKVLDHSLKLLRASCLVLIIGQEFLICFVVRRICFQ